MSREKLLQQRKIQVQQLLERIDQKINSFQKELIGETRVEEKLRIKDKLEEAASLQKQFEEQLNQIEFEISGLSQVYKQPQSKEITYHALLTNDPTDNDFAEHLADQMKKNLLRSPMALFANRSVDFERLDRQVSQCHTVIMVLSEALLNQLEVQTRQTELILNLFKARTGRVIALCRSEHLVRRAEAWGMVAIDVSRWQPGPSSNSLISQVEQAMTRYCPPNNLRTIGLPFVVVAMTQNEASQLAEPPDWLTQRLSPVDRQQLEALKSELEKSSIDPLSNHYALARDQWKPFGTDGPVVHEIVVEIAGYINERNRTAQSPAPQIKAQYYPFDPIVQGQEELGNIYHDIAQSGCVVIVDKLSIFHPEVGESFSKHLLSKSKQAALVAISPLGSSRLSLNPFLETELRQQLRDAFRWFESNYEPNYEFDVGSERRLKRWLHHSLPYMLNTMREPGADQTKLNRFTERVGSPMTDWINSRDLPL